MPCPSRRGSVPGSTPGKRAPILASPFTHYIDEIVKNAVVWNYFVWKMGRKACGSNPQSCPCVYRFFTTEGAVRQGYFDLSR